MRGFPHPQLLATYSHSRYPHLQPTSPTNSTARPVTAATKSSTLANIVNIDFDLCIDRWQALQKLYGEQAFSIPKPATCNSLLTEMRVSNCFATFRSQLKTSFFSFPIKHLEAFIHVMLLYKSVNSSSHHHYHRQSAKPMVCFIFVYNK